jgi:hypothetical protein
MVIEKNCFWNATKMHIETYLYISFLGFGYTYYKTIKLWAEINFKPQWQHRYSICYRTETERQCQNVWTDTECQHVWTETVSACLNSDSVSMSEQRQCQNVWTARVSECLNRDSVSMSEQTQSASMSEQRQCQHVWTETVSECLNSDSVSMSEQQQCQNVWTVTVWACLNRDSVSMSEQWQCEHVSTETVSACLNSDSVSMSEQRQCQHVWMYPAIPECKYKLYVLQDPAFPMKGLGRWYIPVNPPNNQRPVIILRCNAPQQAHNKTDIKFIYTCSITPNQTTSINENFGKHVLQNP